MAYCSVAKPSLFWALAAVAAIFVTSDANAAYIDATPDNFSFERMMKGVTAVDNPGGMVKNAGGGLVHSGEGVIQGQVRVATAAGAKTVPVKMSLLGKLGPVAASGLFRTVSGGLLVSLAAFAVESCVEYKGPGNGWFKLDCFPGPKSEGGLSDGFAYTPTGNLVAWATVYIATDTYLKSFVPATSVPTKSCSFASQNQSETVKYYSCTYNYAQGSNVYSGEFIVTGTISSCPAGKYLTTNGCTDTPPSNAVTEEEFINAVKNRPLTSSQAYDVSKEYPVPIKPGSVQINEGQTKVFPTSAPQTVPGTEPPQLLQRLLQLLPTPTDARPLRVDIKTVTEEVETTEGIPEEGQTPSGGGSTQEPPDDLCVTNPDIIACAKLGDLEADPIKNRDVTLSINKDTGFGPENGTCPAPKSVAILGQTFAFSTQPLCDFALMIRPLIIAFAWFTAAMVFFGFSKKD